MSEILIRCIGMTANKQRVRFKKPDVANNAMLMREAGYVISDPNYDEKMQCWRNKKPFSENGQTTNPLKESFAAPIQTPAPDTKIEQPKNCGCAEGEECKTETKKRGRPSKNKKHE